jgi:hypothetical protein
VPIFPGKAPLAPEGPRIVATGGATRSVAEPVVIEESSDPPRKGRRKGRMDYPLPARTAVMLTVLKTACRVIDAQRLPVRS